MKKYLSLFRIRFIGGMQYRAAAIAGISTQYAFGFIYILMYRAFYQTNAAAFPMTFQQLVNYLWLQQAFLAMINTWSMENDIFSTIESGDIAYELSRPMDLYSLWFVKSMATRLSRAVLRCMPILLVAAILPDPYRLTGPVSPMALLYTLLSMLLGFFCVVAYTMLIYISCFFTLNSRGIRMVALALSDLLSGQLIPLPFFPDKLRQILEWTPFAMIQNLPFRIYGGNIAGAEIAQGFLLQGFWVCALLLLGSMWMRKSLRSVVVQGG